MIDTRTAAIVPADALGTRHPRAGPEARIVSLVPSITELVCELGLTGQLVGRTGFCIHPREALRSIPKVGGTKDVDLDHVRRLAPTHAILNLDENRRETADRLAQFVPHLVVTHPLGPLDNPPLYRLIGGVFGREGEAGSLCRRFDAALAAATAALGGLARLRVLYLIWKNPWMTVSHDTYIGRMLALAGLDSVPAQSNQRYPTLELDAATLARADVVLLASEPYRFRQRDVDALRAMPAMAGRKAALVDGEMTSWYGSRAIQGLAYLPELRAALDAL
jgi:ABC-type Fe3+-hydroxamate transport system substrate-binding protein